MRYVKTFENYNEINENNTEADYYAIGSFENGDPLEVGMYKSLQDVIDNVDKLDGIIPDTIEYYKDVDGDVEKIDVNN